ncbi:hypothetical protein NSB25_08685 [Acetatifactor muris]|uniref:Uncharacterized protein n=1 Tax=Acetatifactor muris TaxID=879566 RepID=A0A2K4ZFB6_9FIRM|nr:hypothetical protein [Acetatifactor muris]MCR2047352.1 hypothetical protein [Acetatifactor muris]SOY29157.1 hypothetical protein AMURIS_01872 [Acetatifactor muris]
MWKEIVVLFREYMGTGLIVIWFVISLLYLWINEKRKELRILFLYTPVILLLLYFNPLFARLVYGVVGEEIYYRILWLLPVTVVIAYTCVSIYGQLAARRQMQKKKAGAAEVLCAVCMAGILAVSGSYIYASPTFSRAENLYHVPDSVINICDAINVPGREVMALFPPELVQYVRQYSPVTCMPYGRDAIVDRWNYYPPICAAMDADVIDLELLVPLAREEGCHYSILPTDREILGKPEDYGWIWFGETDGYVIYRDSSVELVAPES